MIIFKCKYTYIIVCVFQKGSHNMLYSYNLLFLLDVYMLAFFHVYKNRSVASLAMTALCGYTTLYLSNAYVAIWVVYNFFSSL